MLLLMQIIGGIVLALLIIALCFYLYLKISLGSYFPALMNGPEAVPLRLQLNEDFGPTWLQSKKAAAIAKELQEAGYVPDRAYAITEIEEMFVASYRKGPVWVALYQHPMVGNWVDFVFEAMSGSEFTLTNSPMGESAELRPECDHRYFPEASATELAERVAGMVGDTKEYKLPPEDFREYFETSYAKDMQYRYRNGGMTKGEFLGHVRESGQKVKEKDLEHAFQETKLQELDQWSEIALDDFYETLDPKEKEEQFQSHFAFMVPRKTYPEALLDYLAGQSYLEEDERERMKGHFPEDCEIYDMFERLNSSRSPGLRAELAYEAEVPLEHRIYRLKC